MLTRILPLYLQDHRDPHTHPQARVCAACEVRQSALFGALDAEGLERIHAHIEAPQVAVDQMVYSRGQPGAAVYTIRAGIVRFERVTEGGDRRIVRLAGPGDLIGLEALVQRPYSDEAVACTPLQLCRIPRLLVDELGQAESSLMSELMRRWQAALEQSEAWVADLATGAARRRMLKLLQRLVELSDGPTPADKAAAAACTIWLPRRDQMGDMLDLTLETASRLISKLRREGVLELQPPRHAAVNTHRLAEALAEQDRG